MDLQVLIPTYQRPAELALTLSGLAAQEIPFSVVIADQNEEPVADHLLVQTMLRVLDYRGHKVQVLRNPERRGIAQQRHLLFTASTAEHVLMLDDDVWLAPGAIETLSEAMRALQCGFVGMPLIGLSHIDDHREDDLELIDWWEEPPHPEVISPETESWDRYRLHNAANPAHLADRLDGHRWRAYRVAWIGGCTLYRRQALLNVEGWSFWNRLPENHAGEDVLVQLRILATWGGAGVLPSYAFHQEVPTTLPDREHQAYHLIT